MNPNGLMVNALLFPWPTDGMWNAGSFSLCQNSILYAPFRFIYPSINTTVWYIFAQLQLNLSMILWLMLYQANGASWTYSTHRSGKADYNFTESFSFLSQNTEGFVQLQSGLVCATSGSQRPCFTMWHVRIGSTFMLLCLEIDWHILGL